MKRRMTPPCSSSARSAASRKPAKANEEAFTRAVDAITAATMELLAGHVTNAPPKDREVEAAKARARSAQRYAA